MTPSPLLGRKGSYLWPGIMYPLALVAMVGVLFGPLLARGQVPLLEDLCCLFYPWYVFYREHVLQGVLPLWDPYEACGVPFLADCQKAVLYPPQLIFLLLAPSRAIVVYLAFHVFLCGVGAHLLARRLRISRIGALLAGTIYAFNSYTLTKAEYPPQLAAIAWLPIVLWAFIIWNGRRDRRSFAMASVGLALQFLTGYPEVVTFTVGALGIYALFAGLHDCRARRSWARLPTPIVALGCVGLVSMLISMAQLFPSWEALQRSVRIGTVDPDVGGGSVHPLGILNLLVPSVHGVPGCYWAPSSSNYSNTTFYLGVLPCAIFIAAGFRAMCGRRIAADAADCHDPVVPFRVAYLVTVLVVFLLYAMGKYTPVFGLLRSFFPVLQRFVWPAKCLPCVVLSLSCLAGIGLDYVSSPILRQAGTEARWRLPVQRWGSAAVFFALAVVIAVCLLNGGQLGKAVLVRYFNFSSVPAEFEQDAVWRVFAVDGLKCVILGLLSTVLLVTFMLRSRVRAIAPVLVIAVSFADLLHSNGGLLVPGSVSVVEGPSALLDRLRPCGGTVRYLGLEPLMIHGGGGGASPTRWLPKGRAVVEMSPCVSSLGAEEVSMRVRRDNLHLSWATADKAFNVYSRSNFASADVTVGMLGRMAHPDTTSRSKERLLATLNCDRILIPSYVSTPTAEGIVKPSRLVLLEEPLPRAYVVGGVRILEDKSAVFTEVLADSHDPCEVALMERAGDSGYGLEDLCPGRVRHWIKRLEYAPNALYVDVVTEKAGVLVVGDTFDPGWSATVNGRSVPVYKLNGAFRGIRVAAGDNKVRMHYWPGALTIGIAISLTTLMVLVLVLVPVRSSVDGGKPVPGQSPMMGSRSESRGMV